MRWIGFSIIMRGLFITYWNVASNITHPSPLEHVQCEAPASKRFHFIKRQLFIWTPLVNHPNFVRQEWGFVLIVNPWTIWQSSTL